jgi:hypothetical protein
MNHRLPSRLDVADFYTMNRRLSQGPQLAIERLTVKPFRLKLGVTRAERTNVFLVLT